MFGHKVSLNFNKKGKDHKTTVGGFCSLFIRLIMLTYVILLFKRLFLKERNAIETSIYMIDYEESKDKPEGKVDYKSMDVGFYGYFINIFG